MIHRPAFTATGMTCRHCEQGVTSESSRLRGVHAVTVDLPTGTISVHSDRVLSSAEAAEALDEAGYEPAS